MYEPGISKYEQYLRRLYGEKTLLEQIDELCSLIRTSSGDRSDDKKTEDFLYEHVCTDFPKGDAAKEKVFEICLYQEPIPFEEYFSDSYLKGFEKIGEGRSAEVYRGTPGRYYKPVYKIIPIEGNGMVNGEKQKRYEDILPEMMISTEIDNLRTFPIHRKNHCPIFSHTDFVFRVRGRYPQALLDHWNLYKEKRVTRNDSPEMFIDEDQVYVVLRMEHAGQPLAKYKLENAKQAYSIFQQVACALAAAEDAFHFEHRDLHWGNLLVKSVDRNKMLDFIIHGQEIEIATMGVEATIIDFSLSRMIVEKMVCYKDLSKFSYFFDHHGSYQFDMYRAMRERNKNDWRKYEPYTNIIWLHFMLHQFVMEPVYKSQEIESEDHTTYFEMMKKLKKEILEYDSALDFVKRQILKSVKVNIKDFPPKEGEGSKHTSKRTTRKASFP